MGVRSILSLSRAYSLFDKLVGGSHCRQIFLRHHVRILPGQRLLDIGCGNAEILSELPVITYVGVDPEPSYIEGARRRYGSRGTFHCCGVEAITAKTLGSFDVVVAKGVLHHLNDDLALHLFEIAKSVLRPTGYLTTLDGCFSPGQSRVAQWLFRKDRGGYVRTQDAYEALAKSVFPKVTTRLYHKLLRIPYTHLVMECRG